MGGELIADTFYSPNSVWPCSRLVDCTSDGNISYGIVQPGRNQSGGVPIVRVNNFSQGHLDVTDHMTVDSAIESKHKKTRLEGGEVLLTLVGSTGQSAIVPSNMSGWNVARAIAVIRPSAAVGASWIELCLRSAETKHFLDSRANTTVQKTLNLKDVKEVPIPIPPSSVRGAIEKIATRLDRKIELNRQTNETLEAMAQALFKSWFVDFDPVIDNALSAGNDIPEPFKARTAARQALGNARKPLPEEIRREFPDGFEFRDEMGWVPRGWEVGMLEDVLVLQRGFDLPKRLRTDGAYALASSGGQDGTHNQYKVKGPGVVTGRSGRIGIVSLFLDDHWPLNTTLWIKDYPNSNPFYAYFLLRLIDLEKYGTGSAVPTLNRNHVHSLPQVLVPKSALSFFEKECSSIYEKINASKSQTSFLSSLRDTLLPKLLSGQLTIPDAEKLISNAT